MTESEHTVSLKFFSETNTETLKSLIKYTPSEERRAVRRLDYTVLPVVTVFYFLSFLDRANIGNARVAGLQKGLHLTDHQYQICVTVLYVPYIAAELPANLLLRRIGPRILMPTLLTTWGVMVTLQGFVNSFGGLVAVRACLGLVMGPMFPGIVLYLSSFYSRKELTLRIAYFFSAASLSGAFSGLLAAAIENMDGIGGRPGWSWIFILEGLFSVLMGLIGFFVLPSTPRDSKFLTDEQKDIIEFRLDIDRPTVRAQEKFTFVEVWRSFSSLHVIFVFVIFFMSGAALYGLANFLPSIVNQLGFSATKSQLLSVGPFAAGFLLTLLSAKLSDLYRARGIPTAIFSILALVGYSVYFSTSHKFVAYGALYLMVPGIYVCAPILASWMSNNSEPHFRRATSIAMAFVATNAGGILSTWMFPTNEGPRFKRATIMKLTFVCLIILGSLTNTLILNFKNKQKIQQRDKILEPYAEDKDGGERAWMELGDRHPDFKYTL